MSTPTPIFSLKWKAGLFFGCLILLFNISLPLMVYWNLQQKFELFRQHIQQQYQQQLFGQIKTTNEELARLAEFIMMPATSKQNNQISAIIDTLNQRQSELELNWNVTQAQIYDNHSHKIGGWGINIPSDIKAHIPAIAESETSASYLDCQQGCKQYQLLPVLNKKQTNNVLVIGYDISNTLLNFHTLTGANVAVLSKEKSESFLEQNDVIVWEHHVNALTAYSKNINYLKTLADIYPYDIIANSRHIIRSDQLPVEFFFIHADNKNDIAMLIIDDIAGQREEILQITYRSVFIALLGVAIIGGSLFFFLSAPLRRLSNVSRALPLLAEKRYFTVRELLNAKASNNRPDELDVLESSTQLLSDQLEVMETSINERTDALNQSTVELKRERDFIKNLIDTAQLIIITLDKECKITSFNHFAEKLSGYTTDDVLHTPVQSFFSNHEWSSVLDTLKQLKQNQLTVSQMETEFVHRNGQKHIISWLHSSLNEASEDTAILSVGIDVTDKKDSEDRMQWMANHDVVTELYNRHKFGQEFEDILHLSQRYDHHGILLSLDLDQFKDINDSCGHKVGDQLLHRVAELLRSIMRTSDIIARLGGDEFAIIIPETDLKMGIQLCEKIKHALYNMDFTYNHIRYSISCSIGMVQFPLNDLSVDELISNADLAMYQAKARGKNTWHHFNYDDMARSQLHDRITWKHRIEEALKLKRFVLFYQPIMSISSTTVSHYEVLIRMRDENDQILLPSTFIQVAEQTGLIHQIDHYVLEQGIATLAELKKQNQSITLSLNLSAHAIVDPDLQPLLKRLLEQYDANPKQLVFELTETAAVADIPQARELMQEIKSLGCQFSLDDFGTGFASFRYLRELPVDIVKIDGSFITNITENADDRLFVQALVTVAKGMGKKTVAEFVENAQILAMLQALGVDYAQGYYIGKPQPTLLSGPIELD